LRVTVNEMQKRLDALDTAQEQAPAATLSTTNEPTDPLSP
jgi:hypothetical protein